MTVGEKIRILRIQKGLTQKELGFYIGLSDVRIRQYETNIRTPKDSQLISFAEYFGVPIEYFRDHLIDTPIDAMHTLFDLKNQYGGEIIQVQDKSNKTKYAICFDDIGLNNRINGWYDKANNINKEFQKFPNLTQAEWEQQYPNSNITDTNIKK